MTHSYTPDPLSFEGDCLVCGTHCDPHGLQGEPVPEPSGLPDVVLPEDAVDWSSIPCPRCGSSGPCLGDVGYTRPHRQRIEAARRAVA